MKQRLKIDLVILATVTAIGVYTVFELNPESAPPPSSESIDSESMTQPSTTDSKPDSQLAATPTIPTSAAVSTDSSAQAEIATLMEPDLADLPIDSSMIEQLATENEQSSEIVKRYEIANATARTLIQEFDQSLGDTAQRELIAAKLAEHTDDIKAVAIALAKQER